MRKNTTMQEPSPLAHAQNAVNKAKRAVHQAQSHPNAQTIEQAQNALDRAQHAVSRTDDNIENPNAVEEIKQLLQQEQSDFQQIPPQNTDSLQ